ncbi:MAG: hypothetical protein HND44_23875 [Chloroflexi bacterium]|nr:hypothetical protein [Ardenticatenaceae bacterium]NOG37581.1 hypothetical protein [Chloroflexota bacterium]
MQDWIALNVRTFLLCLALVSAISFSPATCVFIVPPRAANGGFTPALALDDFQRHKT